MEKVNRETNYLNLTFLNFSLESSKEFNISDDVAYAAKI